MTSVKLYALAEGLPGLGRTFRAGAGIRLESGWNPAKVRPRSADNAYMPTQASVEDLRRTETPEIAVPETCEASLAKMVRDFEQDAPRKRRLIHDLLKQDRPRFLSAAIRLLKIHET